MHMITSYTDVSLRAFMLSVIAPFADTYDITINDLVEAANTVTLLCGVSDISEELDLLKVRAIATTEAFRYLYSVVSQNFDYADGEIKLNLSQVMDNVQKLLTDSIAVSNSYLVGSKGVTDPNSVVITHLNSDYHNPYSRAVGFEDEFGPGVGL